MPSLSSKIKGGIIGLAVADYLGMPFEFKSKENIIQYFEDFILELLTTRRGGE